MHRAAVVAEDEPGRDERRHEFGERRFSHAVFGLGQLPGEFLRDGHVAARAEQHDLRLALRDKMPGHGDKIFHRPALRGTILGPRTNRQDEAARTGHDRRLFAQFRQRRVAGAAERGDQIEIIKALVQPGRIARRRGNGVGQKAGRVRPRA